EAVIVESREGDAVRWFGDGVSTDRGFVATAAFHEAQADAIFVLRNNSGNLVTLNEDFRDSSSLSNGIPSINDTRPMRSLSAIVSSKIRAYPLSCEHPRKIWWQ